MDPGQLLRKYDFKIKENCLFTLCNKSLAQSVLLENKHVGQFCCHVLYVQGQVDYKETRYNIIMPIVSSRGVHSTIALGYSVHPILYTYSPLV